jgi:hypothetical protein
MNRMVFAFAFLLAAFWVMAQQPGQFPRNRPPYATPPTFPEGQVPDGQMPPDKEARPLSTSDVQEQIQQNLNSEPALANSDVRVQTSERSVVLGGTVNSERQHQLALGIALSYAGERRVVDHIKVEQQT